MNVLEVLIQQLDEKALQLQEALAAGRVETFEEYKNLEKGGAEPGVAKRLVTAEQMVTIIKARVDNPTLTYASLAALCTGLTGVELKNENIKQYCGRKGLNESEFANGDIGGMSFEGFVELWNKQKRHA